MSYSFNYIAFYIHSLVRTLEKVFINYTERLFKQMYYIPLLFAFHHIFAFFLVNTVSVVNIGTQIKDSVDLKHFKRCF